MRKNIRVYKTMHVTFEFEENLSIDDFDSILETICDKKDTIYELEDYDLIDFAATTDTTCGEAEYEVYVCYDTGRNIISATREEPGDVEDTVSMSESDFKSDVEKILKERKINASVSAFEFESYEYEL